MSPNQLPAPQTNKIPIPFQLNYARETWAQLQISKFMLTIFTVASNFRVEKEKRKSKFNTT